MNSILKVTVKNLLSKKGRSFMLLISIVLSAGLVYASLNISLLTRDIFTNSFTKEYGETNIVMHKDDFSIIDDDIVIDDVDYVIGTNNFVGYTTLDSNYTVNMQSFNLEEFETVYDITFLQKDNSLFTGNKILIGEENSTTHNITIGDSITLSILGNDYDLVVYGIVAEGDSYLDYTSNQIDIVVTKDFITDALEVTNFNLYLIKTDNSNTVSAIETAYPELTVLDIYNQEVLIENVQSLTVPLMLTVASVVLVSAFIIFSTYKIIVIERLAFIGTIRSIGASKRKTTTSLLLESVLYGLIGGIFGIFMGIGFLQIMFNVLFSSTDFTSIEVAYFNPLYGLFTVILAILLTVLSSIIPIIKTTKYSIKEVMFSEIKNNSKLSIPKAIIGLVLIIISILLQVVSTHEIDVLTSLTSVLFVSIGFIFIIPLLLIILSPILEKILYLIFGNNAVVAMKNIRFDKTLLNNIVLLTVGLGVIFVINNFSGSVASVVVDAYATAQFDLIIDNTTIDDDMLVQIENIDDIDTVLAVKQLTNVQTDKGFELMYLKGVNVNTYDEFGWDTFGDYLSQETMDSLDEGNNVILTNFISKKYDIPVGDYIGISTDSGIVPFKVIGTVSNVLYNGNITFIADNIFDENFEIEGYQEVFIHTSGDIATTKNAIKELYPYGVLPIESLQQMLQTNQDGNQMIFSLMRGVSLIAMFIGSIGIINNFLVSFISRKQLVANLRSLGLSTISTIKLFLVEALGVGLIGGILSVIFGVIYFTYLSLVLESLNITSEVFTYSFKEMAFVFGSSIVLSLIASISPAIKLAKQNIVKGIKYE